MRKSVPTTLIFLVTLGFYCKSYAEYQPMMRSSYTHQKSTRLQKLPVQNRYYAEQTHSKKMISASQAKQMAEDKYGGKALSVKLEGSGDWNSVYRVKIIKDGRIKTVSIPVTP